MNTTDHTDQVPTTRLPRYWAVVVRVSRTHGGYSDTRHSATFFLDSRVQGFLDADGARRVARDLIRALLAPGDDARVHADASPCHPEHQPSPEHRG